MELLQKKCVPCEGGVAPLKDEEVERYLNDVPDWRLNKGDVNKIERDFTFKNFKAAMEFVNKVADLAEKEGHHPNILVHGWNKVKLILYTHAIKGLHENDFVMAAKINQLLA